MQGSHARLAYTGAMVKASEADAFSPKWPPGKHPNSLANLKTKWRPGESGNPAGRAPIGPLVTPALRRYAALTAREFFALDLYTGCTMAEVVAAALLTRAMEREGDKARAQVLDRLDGVMASGSVHLSDNSINVLIREYPSELGPVG